ncbi:MAG: alpha-amylase family glycosyl hydrolase, partial [Alphaproteobacteria bacterium]
MTEPRATYRLQLHAGFRFADAAKVVPYLAVLGISHLYLSPILAARDGSTHGYDVVDPTRVSAALGGEDGLRSLAGACRAAGLGLIVDIVPNHMAVGSENPWWQDVLARGAASAWAGVFDIDWEAEDPALRGRVLCPFLDRPYGAALEQGMIVLARDPVHGFAVRHHDQIFPIAPADHAWIAAESLAAFDPAT